MDPLDPLDPLDPRMGSFFRVLGIKNTKMNIQFKNYICFLCFLFVFVVDFAFSQCFEMIWDAFLLKSCSTAAPAAPGGCGGLGQLWEALAELWEALGELWEALYIEKLPINRPSGRYSNLPPGTPNSVVGRLGKTS